MLPGVIKTARSIDLRCHSIRDRFPCAFQKASANLMKDVRHHGYCSLFISLLASSMSTRGTNDGLSVIHYARRMIDADIDVSFSTSWFEHNQHMSALSDVMTLPENNEGSGKDPFETLREELVFLFDHLADKYNTVRDEDFEPLCTNIVNDDTDEDDDDDDDESSSTSSSPSCCDTSVSGSVSTTTSTSSDSDWTEDFDDDASHDDSSSLKSNNSDSDESAHFVDTRKFIRFSRNGPNVSSSNGAPADKLLCPGDVVEYKMRCKPGPGKRSSITTIVDSTTSRSLLLRNGEVLKPKEHYVKKVKMYCGATDNLIPNPLAEWFDVGEYVLQEGTLLPPNTNGDLDDASYESTDFCNDDDDGYVTKIGRKRQRQRASDGTTNNKVSARLAEQRRVNKYMQQHMPYVKFPWVGFKTNRYYAVISHINDKYRKMLSIGKVEEVFRKIQKGVCTLLTAKTWKEFQSINNGLQRKYDRHCRENKTVLAHLRIHTELVPDPRRYEVATAIPPTNGQIVAKEQILTYEHFLSSLNILKCPICKECNIVEKPAEKQCSYKCDSCRKRNDPDFFIDNNLHPVWYLVDSKGDYVLDSQKKKIPQFHVPKELSSLSMAEKLLIRRCSNFIPSVHIKSGIFGIRGHCVTFPQDITQMCDELPQRKESIVTFVRNIGNSSTSSISPSYLKVNKNKVIEALLWLKKHNIFYKNIQIKEDNFDWMDGASEANIMDGANEFSEERKLTEEEEEFVAKGQATEEVADADCNDEIPVTAMHSNNKSFIPSTVEAQPIKELIDIARETDQTQKVMQFPPIDHDAPIS